MLSELVVEGLGVIDRADLQLTVGSSALTGETGAGKTLLVAALGSLRGGRADRAMVRQGSSSARIDARFEIAGDHPVIEVLARAGFEDKGPGSEVILSRTIGLDGRSKAHIDGRPVTVAVLQEVGRALIEIAGQHEHHELASSGAQRRMLDVYADASEMAGQLAQDFAELTNLRDQLAAMRTSARDAVRIADTLSQEIREIEEVAPVLGETEELSARASRLEHAETIAVAIDSALADLKGEQGVGELIASAHRSLEPVIDKDPALSPLVERIRVVGIEVSDIAEELHRGSVRSDPVTLAATRDRLASIARLLRKYGEGEAEVLAYLDNARSRSRDLDDPGLAMQRLEREIAIAEERAEKLASQLSKKRKTAAVRMEPAVEEALKDLALTDATFVVRLDPCELGAGGRETVTFMVSANVGQAPAPLTKVASGGELSRIALALKTLASGDVPGTLVFDEVDAGVGGAAARAVGRYLAELGKRPGAQVLVVTHLPQVAAFAEHQYRVTKSSADSSTTSVVQAIEGDDRVEELSRMLAGLPESERAREHAQELLELAVDESAR
jgi:DNA repair protein RecN (Recombination protein N)